MADDIAVKLRRAGEDAEVVMKEMISKIREEVLSVAEAENYFGQMAVIF